jgi:hypothetical protein
VFHDNYSGVSTRAETIHYRERGAIVFNFITKSST